MRLSNNKGQTLLELLIAFSILAITVITTIALIVASIRAGRESTNKLIGASLAREAVEIARNIRDSNWSSTATLYWDSGLSNGTDVTFSPQVWPTSEVTPLYFDPSPSLFTDNQYTLVKQSDNEYVQGSAVAGTSTQFFRMVYLNPICQKDTGEELIASQTEQTDCGQAGSSVVDYPNKVGIRIIAEVRWPTSNSSKHIIVEDRLYNWQVL